VFEAIERGVYRAPGNCPPRPFREELPDGDGVRVGAVAFALEDGQQKQVFEFADGRRWCWHGPHCRQNTAPRVGWFRGGPGGPGCSAPADLGCWARKTGLPGRVDAAAWAGFAGCGALERLLLAGQAWRSSNSSSVLPQLGGGATASSPVHRAEQPRRGRSRLNQPATLTYCKTATA
jgi:hypothetical protein